MQAKGKYCIQRNQKHLIHLINDQPKFNYHNNRNLDDEELEFRTTICDMMPSRRSWVKLSKKDRFDSKGTLISAPRKNYLSLLKTIYRDKENSPNKDYLKKLDQFIEDIQTAIEVQHIISTPQVIAFPKKDPKKGELSICSQFLNMD